MRKKLIKYDLNKDNSLIVEPGKEGYVTSKGQWEKSIFNNKNDITLEIACGKGEYSVGLGKMYPEKNFIGIDIRGERIREGANEVTQLGLKNIRFLRTIIHNIKDFFAENEVQNIRIVHPDPRPRRYDEKRRLTHPRFLKMYEWIMKKGGTLYLKTDDTDFFHYSIESLVKEGRTINAITFDLYNSNLYQEHHGIKTHYEKMFTEQGRTVKYLRCTNNKKLGF